MLKNKIILNSILLLGLASIVVGFFGSFLLQTTHGVIIVSESHTSRYFSLKQGMGYQVNAIGENYAGGLIEGTLTLSSVDTSWSESYNLYTSFDGEATIASRLLGTISVPRSGEYYLTYVSIQESFVGTIKIALQESMVQSLLGISELTLIPVGIGIILIRFIIIGPIFRAFSSSRRPQKPISQVNQSFSEIRPRIEFDEQEDTFSAGQTRECHLCGNISDGLYCEKCGTHLKG